MWSAVKSGRIAAKSRPDVRGTRGQGESLRGELEPKILGIMNAGGFSAPRRDLT
jgi:hypothetical protein